jgi:hypothetical protein
MATKRPSLKKSTRAISLSADPTTDDALLALPKTFAAAPDMPVGVAQAEISSLARLAAPYTKEFAKIGITADKLLVLARFGARLKQLEAQWQGARAAVSMTAQHRKMLRDGEALDAKLLAGGRWACRRDEVAQAELSRIAEGAGLADTVQDLRDLVAFWQAHPGEIANTDVTPRDLTRAIELADALTVAVEKEANDVAAARAQELRNRCFWAADELAREVREGGRYAFRLVPKIGAKFVSRYRVSAVRRARRKTKGNELPVAAPAPGPAAD